MSTTMVVKNSVLGSSVKVTVSITVKQISKACHCKSPAPGQFVEEGDCLCGVESQHAHCESCGGVWKE